MTNKTPGEIAWDLTMYINDISKMNLHDGMNKVQSLIASAIHSARNDAVMVSDEEMRDFVMHRVGEATGCLQYSDDSDALIEGLFTGNDLISAMKWMRDKIKSTIDTPHK